MTGEIGPWRDRTGQTYLTDRRLLALLSERGPARPSDLTDDRRRENVARLQCRYLSRTGFVSTVARDPFEIDTLGRAFLDGESEGDSGTDTVDLTRSLQRPTARTTDWTVLNPEEMQRINVELLDDSSQRYGRPPGER